MVLCVAWLSRRRILAEAGSLLCDEDQLVPAEVIVVSSTIGRAGAMEASLLYRQRLSARIVMADWMHDPLAGTIRDLGIPYLDVTELSQAILERSGVPVSAVTVLPQQVDGTESEGAAIAAFVNRHHPGSLLVITARTHTARTKLLLRRKLPHDIRVSVRSSRFDAFSADSWWRARDQTREVLVEYLRWVNTLLLPNLWPPPASVEPTRLALN